MMGSPDEIINADTLTMIYGKTIEVLSDRTGRLVVVGQPDAPTSHRHE